MFTLVIRVLAVLLLWIVAGVQASGQRIAQHAGLNAENISAVLLDHQGFMWIGSQQGLFFYNGYQLQAHKPNISEPGSIAALDIRNLYQSRDNHIWVSTNSGGLSRYNPATQSFTNYRHQSADNHSLSNDSVYDVIEGANGQLWVATQIGLNRLDPKSGMNTRYFKQEGVAGSLPGNYVYKLFVDSLNRLWVGTLGGGLAYWQDDATGFVTVPLPQGNHDVFAIAEQAGECLWVGTRLGLIRIGFDDLAASQVELGSITGAEPIVASLMLDADVLYVGTLGHGLHAFRPGSGYAKALTPGSDDTVTSIIKSQSGQLYYATWGSGVFLYDSPLPARSAAAQTDSFWHALPDVTAVLAEQDGDRVWLGSFSHGLHWMDMQTRQLSKLDVSLGALQLNGIVSLATVGPQALLVGASNGLWYIDNTGRVLGFWGYDPDKADSIGKGFVRVLEPGKDGDIWVGIGGDGLYRFDISSGGFTAYRHDPDDPSSLSGNYITSLLLDGRFLWVGTRSNGLNLCELATMSCQRLLVSNSGLTHFYISDIAKDRQGRVWVGTDGGGLHTVTLDQHMPGGVNVTADPRLATDSVKAILPQDDGNIWVATNTGIFAFSPADDTFQPLADPVLTHAGSFIQRSKSAGPAYSVFGSHNGVYLLTHATGIGPAIHFPMRFTRLAHDGLPDTLQGLAITERQRLTIPWEGMLSVEFALLDFAAPSHSYEYRVSPSDSWIPLNNMNHLNFYKMEPGLHRLQVRGLGTSGVWSEPAQLEIAVIPPWWRNTRYMMLALILLCLLAVMYHRYRMARWERYTRKLTALKEDKLKVIAQLRQNEQQLQTAFEGMRSLATRLQHAKEEERKSISRELHDQFGQSLTATQISLQLFRRQHPQGSQQIDQCIDTIQGMIKQVRAISFDLRPSLLDDVGLVAGISHQLRIMSSSLSHPITFVADEDFPRINPELTITLFRVIQESVTNAIRHAMATRIEVTLAVTDSSVRARISDNGIGFDIDSVKAKISGGRHLGLLGVEERVLSLAGDLEINAAVGGGVSITVEFPYAE
ncbi:ligand-binding sensor domain-containing protein [Shewanella sp. GXUN23E]|uniref:ligand-binding sensor domain-containing protein n=1 Tax=Shewanella sp. GXUN23E TaxID=3422498 RepID=UPI003D7D420E